MGRRGPRPSLECPSHDCVINQTALGNPILGKPPAQRAYSSEALLPTSQDQLCRELGPPGPGGNR